LKFNCSDESLGQSVKNNLSKFSKKNILNKKVKTKDWPAFKASKLKSIKEFEKKYFRISIHGANEANIILVLEADMKSKNNINLTSSISVYTENQNLGSLIKNLFNIQINRTIE